MPEPPLSPVDVNFSPPGENARTSFAPPCRDSWCSYLHCWKVCRSMSLAKLDLGLGVEQIDHEGADLVGFGCRRCIPEPSASSPTPTPSKAVVKSVQSLLIARDLHCYDADIATRLHLGPAFGC